MRDKECGIGTAQGMEDLVKKKLQRRSSDTGGRVASSHNCRLHRLYSKGVGRGVCGRVLGYVSHMLRSKMRKTKVIDLGGKKIIIQCRRHHRQRKILSLSISIGVIRW